MSQPQYMRDLYKDHKAPSSIVVSAEAIMVYVFTITKNESQFPKALRYSLISELQKCTLKICKHVYAGNNKKPTTKEDFKLVEKCQAKTYKQMSHLKALINASLKIANMKNFEHMAELYVNLSDAYTRWLHNTRRAKARAKKSGVYTKKERRIAYNKNRIRSQAGRMPHDEDGFIILRRREVVDVA